MSLHKAQIFAIIFASLAIFGFLMSQVSATFSTICSQTQGSTGQTVINGSVANVTAVQCQGIIDSNVLFIIGVLASIAAFCALPFV